MRIFKPNISKMQEKKDVPSLIKVLYDKDYDLRDAAAKALEQIGDAQAVEPLIEALKDKNRLMHGSAAKALGKIGIPAVKPLLACINDSDTEVRKAAIRALGIIGDKQAIEHIAAALNDKDKNVVCEAAEALTNMGDERGKEILKQREEKLRKEAPSKETSKVVEIGSKITCANCNKDFIWNDSFHQQDTPGSGAHHPPGHGMFRPRAFCPNCGFMVAEWDIDKEKDRNRWRWFDENERLNRGHSLPPSPVSIWGKYIPEVAIVHFHENKLDFSKLNEALQQIEKRKIELEEVERISWNDRWTIPSLTDAIIVPSDFLIDLQREISLLDARNNSDIVKVFIDHMRAMNIPDEKERWLKGSSESLIKYIGSKITKASKKPGFSSYSIVRTIYEGCSEIHEGCPVIIIRIHKSGRFSDCWIAKNEAGEFYVLDGFHSSYF